MNLETCIKYLNFVAQECDKHILDGKITDDELINLIVEFQHFKDQINQSDLPDDIKLKISNIRLESTHKGVERGSMFLAAAIMTFGAYAILIHMRNKPSAKEP